MVDLTYWQSLPSQSKLSLEIKCGDECESGLFTYWHLVDDELVYGELVLDGDEDYFNNLEGWTFTYECHPCDDCFVEGEKHLHIFNVADSEFMRCEVKILSESKTDKLPLNFVSIPSKYYKSVCEKWREVHLAHDYMDQGWTDIIGGEGVEHLMNDLPLFQVQNDEVVIWKDDGLWIDRRDLHKLEASIVKNNGLFNCKGWTL